MPDAPRLPKQPVAIPAVPMLSLESLASLSVDVLHRCIAEVCEGWTLLAPREHAQTGCTHQARDGSRYNVPDYTAEWDALMPLVLRYGIAQIYLHHVQEWELYHHAHAVHALVPLGNAALHRRRLAELVLYVALRMCEEEILGCQDLRSTGRP